MNRCGLGQQGITLIELIIAIIVISVALTGVLAIINYTTSHSADALLQHQAIAIAEAYLEEITLKDFVDPDNGAVCGAAEAQRNLYDNVCDYNGLNDTGAYDQSNTPITGLESYTVSVSVVPQALNGIAATDALRIDVNVTDPAGSSISLGSFRTRY